MASPEKDLARPVQYLKGVGPKRAGLFEKLGVRTIEDLLFYLPQRYEDRSRLKTIAELEPDTVETVRAAVKSASASARRGRRRVFEAAFADKTGVLRATWFHYHSAKAFLSRFRFGSEWIVSGKVTINRLRGSKEMIHPETEEAAAGREEDFLNLGRIVPVYGLTAGLSQRAVRAATAAAMPYAALLEDFVPEELNRRYNLPGLAESVARVHWPEMGTDVAKLENFQTRERKKLVFNEFFLLQAGLALNKKRIRQEREGVALKTTDELMSKIYSVFPFTLTRAQRRSIAAIASDMSSKKPMNRLLQGDVGSGKTAVALAAALIAVRNRRQAAIMAPTEILAAQHFRNFQKLLEKTKVRMELLTSGAPSKKTVYEKIASGEIHIAVGTHALIQEKVKFHSLGLAIIDEQHRFGVRQRAELIGKGEPAHTLIMTATPIPRTLAMTLYGDLDVSVIDELPPGRAAISTTVFPPGGRGEAVGIVRREVEKGRQAYIVCPLVEESEKLQLKAATAVFERLSGGEFAGFRLGLIHGRMKSAEKDGVMERFTSGAIDILVATSVVEVGVDQPNATAMMIESADRFGLSQLHQLRGRVGRASHRSYCLLMADARPGTPAWRRLKVMEKTTDGFRIAEEDLALRGAGDLFGERQWGLPALRVGDIVRDHKILAAAREAAFDIIKRDSGLAAPESRKLREAVKKAWTGRFKLGEVG
ncbi:MAG: ATP-dependent DNA helicase RecG [Candidatus Nitrospinota bacterium M3_3B_026]